MSTEKTAPAKHDEGLLAAIASMLWEQARRARKTAVSAERTVTLATHSLKEYARDSPWWIAEQAVLENARRIYEAETANADNLVEAAHAIEAMG
jgi:hypothetical protein